MTLLRFILKILFIRIKRLSLNKNDIIILKLESDYPDNVIYTFSKYFKTFLDKTGVDPTILVLAKNQSIETLSQEELRKLIKD